MSAVLRLVASSSWSALEAERDELRRRVDVLERGAERRQAASAAGHLGKARLIARRREHVAAAAVAERWLDPLRKRSNPATVQRIRERLFLLGIDVSTDTIERDIAVKLGPSPLAKK